MHPERDGPDLRDRPAGLPGRLPGRRHDQTGKIGYFGGAKIPTVTIFGVGLQQGIEAYNAAKGANVELLGWDNRAGEGVFTGDFTDISVKAKQTATSLYDEGADIVIGVGGLIGSVSFPIAQRTWWLWHMGRYRWLRAVPEMPRPILLTSIMKGMNQVQLSGGQVSLRRHFPGLHQLCGFLANQGVQIAPFHDVDRRSRRN